MELWNVVLEGGGAKGIALVGPLQAAELRGMHFRRIVGTSAGAIVAALYAAGYSSKELQQLLEATDFAALLDPIFPKWWGAVRHWGIHRGQRLFEWIYACLKKKGIVRFNDLKDMELEIVASDITNRRKLILSRTTYPDMEIAYAVRMSISIPFFFRPERLGQSVIVDGGLLSNYAVSLCNDDLDRTFGVKLVTSRDLLPPRAPHSAFDFLGGLLCTMLEAHDKEDYLNDFYDKTIHVPTGDVSTYDFRLSRDQKLALLKIGWDAAWEHFEAYPDIYPRYVPREPSPSPTPSFAVSETAAAALAQARASMQERNREKDRRIAEMVDRANRRERARGENAAALRREFDGPRR